MKVSTSKIWVHTLNVRLLWKFYQRNNMQNQPSLILVWYSNDLTYLLNICPKHLLQNIHKLASKNVKLAYSWSLTDPLYTAKRRLTTDETCLEHRDLLRTSRPRPLCSQPHTHICPRPIRGSVGSAKNLDKHTNHRLARKAIIHDNWISTHPLFGVCEADPSGCDQTNGFSPVSPKPDSPKRQP